MKVCEIIALAIVSSLMISGQVQAGTEAVKMQGRIGDYAPDAGIYEVAGKPYRLSPETAVVSSTGEKLDLDVLTGGVRVILTGERNAGSSSLDVQQVIVLEKQDLP